MCGGTPRTSFGDSLPNLLCMNRAGSKLFLYQCLSDKNFNKNLMFGSNSVVRCHQPIWEGFVGYGRIKFQKNLQGSQ